MKKMFATFMAFWIGLAPSIALADPCGMVPPIYLGPDMPIARIGLQQTYVFYKDGVESLVLRPGFAGKVDEFGMLIPFPSAPEIRKVADDVFSHIAAAVDPPEVVVDLAQRFYPACDTAFSKNLRSLGYSGGEQKKEEEVRVLREEAVGMYEVAVLEAGSTLALKRWMGEHGFRYPEGMDAVCEDYVKSGWCFVAVKTRVGGKATSDPRPGQREIDNTLPEGSSFDGHVQAMGFRFRTDELVVPMRLSAFNAGELRNVVYVLSDGPKRIARIPAEFVQRQIPGEQLYRNLMDPLPLRILGGQLADIPDWRRQSLPGERNPLPHNGIARELFAADLLAVRTGRLLHPLEEREKELLRIGEELGLRGPEVDALHRQALANERERMTELALQDLLQMTLSVIDGDFPREVIAAENIRFTAYSMQEDDNRRESYDAKVNGPAPVMGGFLASRNMLEGLQGPSSGTSNPLAFFAALLLLGMVAAAASRSHNAATKQVAGRPAILGALFGLAALSAVGRDALAQEAVPERCCRAPLVESSVAELHERAGPENELTARGRAILELALLEGDTGKDELRRLQGSGDSVLVQLWASAALVQRSASISELVPLANFAGSYSALVRPLTLRLSSFLDAAAPGDAPDLESALEVIASHHLLQQKIVPRLVERDPRLFVALMLSSKQQVVRNLAAACLATQAARDGDGVTSAVLEALAFRAPVERLPWEGGALFLPACSWTDSDARDLFRLLVSWHLYCERHDLRAERRQVHNNLNNWSLAQAVGYELPNREIDSTRWLLLFGQVRGADELLEVLSEQGLADDKYYQAIVTLVR